MILQGFTQPPPVFFGLAIPKNVREPHSSPGFFRSPAEAGRWMGRGMALLVDTLNPQVIALGSLAVALGDRVLAPARRALAEEALPQAVAACEVVPAKLGKRIRDRDIAALMAALTDNAIRLSRNI